MLQRLLIITVFLLSLTGQAVSAVAGHCGQQSEGMATRHGAMKMHGDDGEMQHHAHAGHASKADNADQQRPGCCDGGLCNNSDCVGSSPMSFDTPALTTTRYAAVQNTPYRYTYTPPDISSPFRPPIAA